MTQDAIWDYFQNEGVASFREASPRLEYIARQISAPARVLNIGVGSGALEAIAFNKGLETWSLDPSERAIKRLRSGRRMGERAQVGYSQNMPFSDGQFDVVVMSEVLEHLQTNERERTLVEVRRVLRSGGRLIGTVPARERLADNEVVCPNCRHQFHRWGHQTNFEVASMKALLELFFAVDTVHERFFNDWESATWPRRLAGLIKKFLSWYGFGTYGQARKIFFVARKTV